jgi:hypothetical protein
MDDHCADCRHFLAPAACKIVDGTISPEAWCDRFEKLKKQAEADRNQDLCGRKDSPVRKILTETFHSVKRGFEDQARRSERQDEFWKIYDCQLDEHQSYQGDAQIFVPTTHDAVNAIVTRWSNELFPEGSHFVNVVSDDEKKPEAVVALLDKYIREGELATQVCKPLIRHGQVEGQYNLYPDWREIDREIVSREMHGPRVQVAQEEIEVPGEDIEDVSVEDFRDARPNVEVLHDSDVCVSPATADNIDEAFAAGGFAAIARRWSKAKIETMADAGHIRSDAADQLLARMEAKSSDLSEKGLIPDIEKELNKALGITKRASETLVLEVWRLLPLGDDGLYRKGGKRRLCKMFFAAEGSPLGCVRNPNWNDRCNLLTRSVEKVGGRLKGKSQVEYVASLQYEENDAVNETADVGHLSAMPIVMRDPTTGNHPLIMNVGAIWPVDPNKVKIAEFPDLTQRGMTRVQLAAAQTFQTLSVNPSMLPQQTNTTRRNQAQVAQEQQVDLLTAAEGGRALIDMFSELMTWFVDLDYQHRDRETTARLYGTRGVKANLEAIPPQRTRTQYQFEWVGLRRARNAQMLQIKNGVMNVLRGIEPSMAQQGLRFNWAPAVEEIITDLWGPHVGAEMIEDISSQMSMDPKLENELMNNGHDVPVHLLDVDQQHISEHQRDIQESGDPHGVKQLHIQKHLLGMKLKQQAQVGQALGQGLQQQGLGGPGGARPSRGGAPPQMGAVPAGPRLIKGPAGSVSPDQMPRAGAALMPRRY